MKIPKDLKPGDRLWCRLGYVVIFTPPHLNAPYEPDGAVWAKDGNGIELCYRANGTECDNDSPPIIRIERIASAPAKKREKADRDAAWLIRLAEAYTEQYRELEQRTPVPRRLRAIARRLNGGKP